MARQLISDGNIGDCPSLHIEAGIAWIVLNRAQRHNQFEPADIEAMSEMLHKLPMRKGVRVLVVTASGSTFSSGFDLRTLASDRASECTAAFSQLCDLFEGLAIPTLCGLNGDVYGAGADLALASDLRIGVEGCCLQMSPARLGVEFYYSGLRRFVERLGLSEAKRLFLTGEQVDTATMLRIGFLNEVCPAEGLKARLGAVAAALAQRSPASLRGLKASLNAIARGTADPLAVDEQFFESLVSPDAREGLKGWFERRPPRFSDI